MLFMEKELQVTNDQINKFSTLLWITNKSYYDSKFAFFFFFLLSKLTRKPISKVWKTYGEKINDYILDTVKFVVM